MAEVVYSSTNDSFLQLIKNSGTATDAVGDATDSATSFSNTQTDNTSGVQNRTFAVRGSANSSFRINRSFFEFDLSGFSGTATSADLKVFSDSLGGGSPENTVYAVEATALAGNVADFGNVFSSGTTVGTLFGSVAISTTAQYHSITGNSDLLTAINSAVGSGTLTIGLMGYYDYRIAAGLSTSWPSIGSLDYTRIHIYYSDATAGGGTGADPALEIEGISVSSGGYGNDVMGVSSANIASVKGVATADIANVIGVD